AKGAEPLNSKERAQYNAVVRFLEEEALKLWAVQAGIWVNEIDFNKRFENRKIGQGAEQAVYLRDDKPTVIKVNTGNYHGNWGEFFLRILFHEILFPTTRYTTVGFTEVDGSFATIIEQQFALLVHGASRLEVEEYLKSFGFRRTKNDDYYNGHLGIILEDLHDENIFIENKHLLFIDPVIFVETRDMYLEGKNVYSFPFR
ncbi:MAG TPA: hypothetical protein VF610_09255, partial [Segetibacter sp.]